MFRSVEAADTVIPELERNQKGNNYEVFQRKGLCGEQWFGKARAGIEDGSGAELTDFRLSGNFPSHVLCVLSLLKLLTDSHFIRYVCLPT